jgi:hypothetical protein
VTWVSRVDRFLGTFLGHDVLVVRCLRSDELLALPVRLHGIPLGRPVDLLLDREELKVVGLDVRCGDEVHRFLPLATAILTEDEIAIRSPLVLLEEDELEFYEARTFTLSSLRGKAVDRAGRLEGALRELVLCTDGTVTDVVVDDGDRRIPFDETVRVDFGSRSAA